MLKYKVFLLLIFVSTISCNNNKEEFYRERFLFRYLNDHKVITGATEYNLILINSTDCGACSIKSIEKIEKSFSLKNNLKKYILVTDKGAPYLSSLNLSNLELIECKANILEKYGLRFFSTYLFHIKDNEIESWERINSFP